MRETTEWTRTRAIPLATFMKFNFLNRGFIVGVPALMQKLFVLQGERVFPRFYRRLNYVCSSSLFLYPSLAEYLASVKIRLACQISGKPLVSCSTSQLVCNGFVSANRLPQQVTLLLTIVSPYCERGYCLDYLNLSHYFREYQHFAIESLKNYEIDFISVVK